MSVEEEWPEALPPAFYEALEEWRRGEFFGCHETLERLWLAERGSVRELYQGVIQLAVGCHHLTARANRVGALSLLDRGARRLERAAGGRLLREPHRYGVVWDRLIAEADRLRAHLLEPDVQAGGSYDPALLPRSPLLQE